MTTKIFIKLSVVLWAAAATTSQAQDKILTPAQPAVPSQKTLETTPTAPTARELGPPKSDAAPSSDDGARAAYEFSERVGNQAAWEAFLSRYPQGFYSDLARAQLAKRGVNSPAPAHNPADPPASAPSMFDARDPADGNRLVLVAQPGFRLENRADLTVGVVGSTNATANSIDKVLESQFGAAQKIVLIPYKTRDAIIQHLSDQILDVAVLPFSAVAEVIAAGRLQKLEGSSKGLPSHNSK